MIKILILFTLFVVVKVNAEEKSITEIYAVNSSTSDDMSLRTVSLSYRNHRRNVLWNYKDSQEKAFDYGMDVKSYKGDTQTLDFSGTKLSMLVGRKFSSAHYLEARLGFHEISGKGSMIPWNIKYAHTNNLFFGETVIEKDYTYYQMKLPQGIDEELKSLTLKTFQVVTPRKFIRVPVRFSYEKGSDNNITRKFSSDIMFGQAYPIWYWVGVGFERVTNSKDANGYWTPERLKSYGLRFEVSYEVVSKLNVNWGFNIGRSKEERFSWARNSYSSLGVRYGDRNEWQLDLNWTNIRSIQNGNVWKQNDILFSAMKSF